MPNIADLFELSMQATIDCVQRVASGGAEMLAVLLKKNVGDAYARPLDEEHARLNSVSFEQWKFPPISDALRSSLPASLVSLVKQVGNPVGNGQCMPLSLMMQSTGCGEKDNDAAKLLRALAVFELIEHVEFYLGLGGVEFVRDVFVSLVGKGRNGQYGYAWPDTIRCLCLQTCFSERLWSSSSDTPVDDDMPTTTNVTVNLMLCSCRCDSMQQRHCRSDLPRCSSFIATTLARST
jgi:hypothetical protein